MRALTPILFGAALLVGCGSSDTSSTGDVDSSTPADSAVSDSGGADSSKSDTTTGDTAVSDGTGGDTTTSDTATGDTATSDGGSDTTKTDVGLDTAGGPCGPSLTCTAGQICTRTHTVGGACLFCGDDAAACGSGMHCSGSCCVSDTISYSYACRSPAGACSGGLTCTGACGTALCTGGSDCESAAPDVVTCVFRAP